VIVSGFGWSGPAAAIINAATAGRLTVITSLPLLAELRRVLAYPKLAGVLAEPDRLVGLVEEFSIVVQPTRAVQVVADEPDNRLLEAALAGAAGYVVSGDRLLLALERFEGIGIVTPAAFRDLLQEPVGE
jgi:uncharacterized protein